MTNIFALIEVPALNLCLDVIIPAHITTRQAVELLVKLVYNMARIELNKERLILWDVDASRALCGDMSLSRASLKDVCRLAIL